MTLRLCENNAIPKLNLFEAGVALLCRNARGRGVGWGGRGSRGMQVSPPRDAPGLCHFNGFVFVMAAYGNCIQAPDPRAIVSQK